MNTELKKIVSKVKSAQTRLRVVLEDKTWVEQARKYADERSKEVKKLVAGDIGRVKTFIVRERRELEKLQKHLPQEVKKLRKFVDIQKKEFERLLARVSKASAKKVATSRKPTTRKKSSKSKSTTAKSTLV